VDVVYGDNVEEGELAELRACVSQASSKRLGRTHKPPVLAPPRPRSWSSCVLVVVHGERSGGGGGACATRSGRGSFHALSSSSRSPPSRPRPSVPAFPDAFFDAHIRSL
jgi:hypothetical protein